MFLRLNNLGHVFPCIGELQYLPDGQQRIRTWDTRGSQGFHRHGGGCHGANQTTVSRPRANSHLPTQSGYR